MRLKLNSGSRKFTITILAAALTVFIGFNSVRAMAAWVAAQTGNWQRAARMEAGNAEWQCDLGVYYTIIQHDSKSAIPYLETGVRLNPHNATCWTALGDAYAHSGDLLNERRTLEAALHAEPNDAHIALNTATIYANSNEIERALPLYKLVLQKRPDWAPRLVRHIWYHDPNADELMDKALPSSAGPRLSLLDLLVQKKEWSSANLVWNRILDGKVSFDTKDALFYLDALLEEGDAESSQRVWQQLALRDSKLADRRVANNLLTNADFEHNILNGGFDWVYRRTDGVDVSVDTAEFHGGNRSLAMNFDGENVAATGLKQLVLVQPGSSYAFRAWIRADSVDTSSGPRFAFSDPRTHQILYSSEDVLGSFPWRSISGDFTAGPGTSLLELSIVRNPSNGRIRGKVWIDDLELVTNP